MRIGVIGRTRPLLLAAEALCGEGHELTFVYTCRAEPHYDCEPEEFEILAKQSEVPYFCDYGIEDKSEFLRSTKTEVCISINWISLLSEDFLSIFPFGVLNGHPGDLPKYRGTACVNWAILHGEPTAAMTIHLMEPQLDSGPVLLKKHFELAQDTYIGDFLVWHQGVVPEMFCEVVNGLESGTLVPVAQEAGGPILRAFPRRPTDSQINWDQPCIEVHRLIRASSSPFHGSLASAEDGRIVRIFRAEIIDPGYEFLAVPGQICEIEEGYPLVACGDNNLMLMLTEFLVEGLSPEESLQYLTRSLRARLS